MPVADFTRTLSILPLARDARRHDSDCMTATDSRASANAVAHFAAKLRFETDPSDVAATLAADPDGLVVVDSRNDVAWEQGHLPAAVHLPTAQIRDRAPGLLSRDRPVVVYCWGPGCNGATRAALEFARLGYAVQEMIGGLEYWAREGRPVESAAGLGQRPLDPLTGPATAAACDC